MAITNAQGWPQLHARFTSKEELLLICELASSRAGFSNLGVASTDRAGNVRCSVTSPVEGGGKKKITCNSVLVGFKIFGEGAGSKQVEVTEVHGEKLEASAHGKAHKDLSVQLSLDSPDFTIKERMRVAGFMSLHLLEGCLRAAARKEKYYLKRSMTSTKDSTMTVSFICAKGAAKCQFAVRLCSEPRDTVAQGQVDEDDEEEVNFRILNIVPKHSCRADIDPPSKQLDKILDAWPKITLGPKPGAPKPLNAPEPSSAVYDESSSDEEAVDQLEEDDGGQDGVRSQTTPGDILVHSDEASIDDEQAPARKKTKFSPAVEESEEQRKHGEKKGRKVTKKAAKLAAAEEGARA